MLGVVGEGVIIRLLLGGVWWVWLGEVEWEVG